MAERTEGDVVAGVLRIEVGAEVRSVPTLKARYVDEWWQRLASPEGAASKPLGQWSEQDVLDLLGHNVERLIDLTVHYDRTGALGGREWLLENADPAQLHAAVIQMMENANPFADAPALLALMLVRVAARSGQPSSTSGASPRGGSTRTRSARGSTRSS